MIDSRVDPNFYFYFLLAMVLLFYGLDMLAGWLNVRALRERLPDEFADVYDQTQYLRSQAYSRDSARLDWVESTVALAAFLGFWFWGGFGRLDTWVRSSLTPEWARGVVYVSALYLGSKIIHLPFGLWATFGIEAKYGFNRTSWSTYVLDMLKGLGLAGCLGLPIFALIQIVLGRFGAGAWWIVWLAVASLSVLFTWLAPRWILPLFHTFRPLPDGELKGAIEDLARRCEFPLAEVLEVDGSKRTSRGNAFFTGFGRHKKIALFDTLVAKHPVPELVAVLAHEIGHFKLRHVWQGLALGILQMGLMFWLLSHFLGREELFAAMGVRDASIYGGLVFFSLYLLPLSRLLGIGSLALSRHNEYGADAYAASATGDSSAMIAGLKRLASDNLSNLTPHPLYVFLNYSHPPMLARVKALRSGPHDILAA